MRKIKMIGLAALAALALTSSVGAASASASVNVYMGNSQLLSWFASDTTPTYLWGTQWDPVPHDITLGNVQVKGCDNVLLDSGNLPSLKVTSVTLDAQYSGCDSNINGLLSTEVKMNSCHYVLHTLGGQQTPPDYVGRFDVACDQTGDGIQVLLSSGGTTYCTMTIPAQSGINKTVYETEAAGYPYSNKSIGVQFDATGIAYSGKGLICGSSQGSHTDGTYTGVSVLQGFPG